MKFWDYYHSTGRPNFRWATNLSAAIELGGEEPIPRSYNARRLYESFPHDRMRGCHSQPGTPHHLRNAPDQPMGAERACV